MPDPAIAPHPIRRRSILRAQLRSRDHVRAPATRRLTCRHACRPRFGVTPRRLVHRPDAGTTGRGRPGVERHLAQRMDHMVIIDDVTALALRYRSAAPERHHRRCAEEALEPVIVEVNAQAMTD